MAFSAFVGVVAFLTTLQTWKTKMGKWKLIYSSNLFKASVGKKMSTDVLTTCLVAGDLVQRSRSSVGNHGVLMSSSTSSCVVLRSLAWTGVGQLD